MFTKLKNLKQNIQEAFRSYPHAFLLGGFIVLVVLVSLVNDAYFSSLFQRPPAPPRPTAPLRPVYLTVISTDPEPGIRQTIDNFQQFSVYFSDNIDPATVSVKASPQMSLGFEVTANKLRVFPRQGWQYDLGYWVEIDARSTGGVPLEEPYKYSMYITLPGDDSDFRVF